MAALAIVLPHSYNDEDDRIAKQILRKYANGRVVLYSSDEEGHIWLQITDVERHMVMPMMIRIHEELLRQNIKTLDLRTNTNHYGNGLKIFEN